LSIARLAQEKKAEEVVIIDLEGRVSYCDRLVICNGTNRRQVRAIAETVIVEMKQVLRRPPLSVEGMAACRWVLVDFGDVILHVFDRELRGFYDLDGLWADADRVEVPDLRAEAARAESVG
jgi:ribosome-associated protein